MSSPEVHGETEKRWPLKLCDAIAQIYPAEWEELKELLGSTTQVLTKLSSPDSFGLVDFRSQLVDKGLAWDAERRDQVVHLKILNLLDKLRVDGQTEKFEALGIFSATGVRQPIPTELWPDLQLDFVNCRAEVKGFIFDYVTISKASKPIVGDALDALLVAWLEEQKTKNKRLPKKSLRQLAEVKFGQMLKISSF